jgi:beta-lactamase superfamily II metal-dependent hydrolase
MIWVIEHLAALPAAAIALRAPPPWLIALLYAPLLIWPLRRPMHLRRAPLINLTAATLIITLAWYTFTKPLGELRLEALDVGQGTAILLHSPTDDAWLINAGSRDATDLVNKALRPALRVAGQSRLAGLILTSMNTLAAQSAGPAIEALHPPIVITAPGAWNHRGETFAGASAEAAIAAARARQVSLTANAFIDLGQNARLRILWPTVDDPPPSASEAQNSLILLLEFRNRRILLLDPVAASSLERLQFNHIDTRADAIILLAPEPRPDASLRQILARTGASTCIWSGRTPWTPIPLADPPGTFNTATGALTLRIDAAGALTLAKQN